MLKKITKWETEDGKVFDTQEEAEDYVFEQESQIAALQAVQAAVPNGRWIERWHGSGGKEGLEGWSILDAESRALVAYLGRNVDSETVTAIVMAHNATSQQLAVPISDELPQGFISDVLTAAGLVRHGEQCKVLSARLGDAIKKIWTTSIAQRKALATPSSK